MKKLSSEVMVKNQGGMPCSQLLSQLSWMNAQGGALQQQAFYIVSLMANGYTMCT